MSETYRPRRGRPSTQQGRGAAPNYTARRIVAALAALALLALVVGGIALAVTGPLTSLFAASGRGSAPKTILVNGKPASLSTAPSGAPSAAGAAGSAAASASAGATASADGSRSAAATVTVAAVGDLMFGRGVADYISGAGGSAILGKVATLLSAADATLGNLEAPLARKGSATGSKDVRLLGTPDAIKGLDGAGFDVVGLANNHAMDYGSAALNSTLSLLDEAGIAHAGAGADKAAASKPAVLESNGARIAFLSFSHIYPAGFVATGSRAGIARSKGRMDEVEAAIRSAKAQNDYVVVTFHWGTEHSSDADSGQRRDAHRAIDAGADLVTGHHPHVIQGVEAYKGRLIAYSLGDFVFDHFSRETGESFVLMTGLGPGGVESVRIVPTYLGMNNGRPEVVKGGAAQRILNRLKKLSKVLGTTVTIAGDEATVEIP